MGAALEAVDRLSKKPYLRLSPHYLLLKKRCATVGTKPTAIFYDGSAIGQYNPCRRNPSHDSAAAVKVVNGLSAGAWLRDSRKTPSRRRA